ncbi:unnamed protein product [Closterium sp. NIES-64]|nr:unnamed protein product [Closterium sp. NIES-64]
MAESAGPSTTPPRPAETEQAAAPSGRNQADWHMKSVAAPFSIALAPPHAAAAAPGPKSSAPKSAQIAASVAGEMETPLMEASHPLSDGVPAGTRVVRPWAGNGDGDRLLTWTSSPFPLPLAPPPCPSPLPLPLAPPPCPSPLPLNHAPPHCPSPLPLPLPLPLAPPPCPSPLPLPLPLPSPPLASPPCPSPMLLPLAPPLAHPVAHPVAPSLAPPLAPPIRSPLPQLLETTSSHLFIRLPLHWANPPFRLASRLSPLRQSPSPSLPPLTCLRGPASAVLPPATPPLLERTRSALFIRLPPLQWANPPPPPLPFSTGVIPHSPLRQSPPLLPPAAGEDQLGPLHPPSAPLS